MMVVRLRYIYNPVGPNEPVQISPWLSLLSDPERRAKVHIKGKFCACAATKKKKYFIQEEQLRVYENIITVENIIHTEYNEFVRKNNGMRLAAKVGSL